MVDQFEDSTWSAFETGDHIVPDSSGSRKRAFTAGGASFGKQALYQDGDNASAGNQAGPLSEVFEEIDAGSLSPPGSSKPEAGLLPVLGLEEVESDGTKAGTWGEELRHFMDEAGPDPLCEYVLDIDERVGSGNGDSDRGPGGTMRQWGDKQQGQGLDGWAPSFGAAEQFNSYGGEGPSSSTGQPWGGQSDSRTALPPLDSSFEPPRLVWDNGPPDGPSYQPNAEAQQGKDGSRLWSPEAAASAPGSPGGGGGDTFVEVQQKGGELGERQQRRGELAGRLKATQEELNKIALEIWAEEQRPLPGPEEEPPSHPSTSGRGEAQKGGAAGGGAVPKPPNKRQRLSLERQPPISQEHLPDCSPLILSPVSPYPPRPTIHPPPPFYHPPRGLPSFGWGPQQTPEFSPGVWRPPPQEHSMVYGVPPPRPMYPQRAPLFIPPPRMGGYPPTMYVQPPGGRNFGTNFPAGGSSSSMGPPLGQGWPTKGEPWGGPRAGVTSAGQLKEVKLEAKEPVTNVEVPAGDKSPEGVVLRHLKGTIEKLDLGMRLHIRDSLYRLSHSAALRAAAVRPPPAGSTASSSTPSSGTPPGGDRPEAQLKFPPPTELTNVVDRSVAHLMYHKHPALEAAGGYEVGVTRQKGVPGGGERMASPVRPPSKQHMGSPGQ